MQSPRTHPVHLKHPSDMFTGALSKNGTVSSEVFRSMLCIRLLAPIPEAQCMTRCICGFAQQSALSTGLHMFSQCSLCSQSTWRHNSVSRVLRPMFAELLCEVTWGSQRAEIRAISNRLPRSGPLNKPSKGIPGASENRNGSEQLCPWGPGSAVKHAKTALFTK